MVGSADVLARDCVADEIKPNPEEIQCVMEIAIYHLTTFKVCGIAMNENESQ